MSYPHTSPTPSLIRSQAKCKNIDTLSKDSTAESIPLPTNSAASPKESALKCQPVLTPSNSSPNFKCQRITKSHAGTSAAAFAHPKQKRTVHVSLLAVTNSTTQEKSACQPLAAPPSNSSSIASFRPRMDEPP